MPVDLHRRLAYVPGDVNLWPNLSGGEVIDLLGRLRGGLDEARPAELIERFELDPRKKGRTYSKGNKQKVAIVAALSSDVELLILDEPTSGLDPLMEAVFQDCIKAEKERGRTSIAAELSAVPGGLASTPGVHDFVSEGGKVRVDVDTDQLNAAMHLLSAAGLKSLTCQPPTLEELFLRHYGPRRDDKVADVPESPLPRGQFGAPRAEAERM